MAQGYWLASVLVILAIISLLVFFVARGGAQRANRLTPLAGLAFAFVIAGIAFGDNRFLAYALFGFGVLLAVVDALRRRRG